MSLNWKEIDLVLSELSLEGSLVQKIRQPDYKSLILDLYRPGKGFSLFISMNQGRVRLHSLTQRIPNRVPLQRFAQLLRSTIQGGRITSIHQIKNERIIMMTISRTEETTMLYIRLWGGNPNIIVTDSTGTILDAFFRRPRKKEISGEKFLPETAVHSNKSVKREEKDFTIRNWNGYSSFNSFIENYYREIETSLELRELEQRAKRYLDAKETQLLSAREILEEKKADGSQFELYRQQAELLKANLYRITPGMKEITVENYFCAQEKVVISLNPLLSPSRNVEALFKKYRKSKTGLQNLSDELQNIKTQLQQLKKNREDLFSEKKDPAEALIQFRDFLSTIQQQHAEKKATGEKIPGLHFTSGRFTILVGRTASENDALLRHHVKGNDYWLHTRDYPGGYVFIKNIRGKSIPLETLIDAGNLALFFSKGRKNGHGELYYTQVKYLRRAKTGKKGLVLPTQEKNLSIRLDQHRLDKLLHRENA